MSMPASTTSSGNRARRGWIALAISLPIFCGCAFMIFSQWHEQWEEHSVAVIQPPAPQLTHQQAMQEAIKSIRLTPPTPNAVARPKPGVNVASPATAAPRKRSRRDTPIISPIAIGVITGGTPPPIERERAELDGAPTDGGSGPSVRFDSNIECGTPLEVKEITPTHYVTELKTEGFRDWFMFRVRGVAGKTIRIDITGDGIAFDNWKSLNPVYSYASDLDDLATYSCSDGDSRQPSSTAWNGAELPSTEGDQWHYIANCWEPNQATFSFAQRFNADSVYVAMRIPYTPGYNERFIASIQTNNPLIHVYTLGKSKAGRPLRLIQISSPAKKNCPCILIYAREHADEQDGSWVAIGAVEWLLSSDPSADQFLQQFSVFVIPLFDVDAAIAGTHEGCINTFYPETAGVEGRTYARFFEAAVNDGARIPIVIDLHNVQSGEMADVGCPVADPNPSRLKAAIEFNSITMQLMLHSSYLGNPRIGPVGYMPKRLIGWLSDCYGSLPMAYEVNCQDKVRHLSAAGLRQMGRIYLTAASDFSKTTEYRNLVKLTDQICEDRLRVIQLYPKLLANSDPLRTEQKIRSIEQSQREETSMIQR